MNKNKHDDKTIIGIVQNAISYIFLILIIILGINAFFLYSKNGNGNRIVLQNAGFEKNDFVYGSWPALENADFFKNTRNNFIAQKISFIEADLSAMTIRYYKNGEMIKEAPITTKGREGSWWETPAGLYQISTKEDNHFSSFGQVNMPYSMQFQGNFFIHGPTSYPDGTPTPSSYSGGCIRVGLDDIKEIYELAEIGTPLLVFEDAFSESNEGFIYNNNLFLSNDTSYLAADLESNFVFAENKSDKLLSIASITKLVTALIAVEYINVEKEIYITDEMLVETSTPRINAGEKIAVLDLLSLLLLESSNEAAEAIATTLGKSYFIGLMNTKANAIGMKNSEFVDISGVLSGNIATAEDLFYLAKYLYFNRSFVLHMSMGKENRIAYGPPRYVNLQNFNDINEITNEVGGKTGISTSAKNSMLSVLEIKFDGKERPVAIIILGSEDAKRDINTLAQHIANNYSPALTDIPD